MAVLALAAASVATATTCSYRPPCGRISVDSVLFVGVVRGVEPVGGDGSRAPIKNFAAQLEVEEVFAGIAPDTRRVRFVYEGEWLEFGKRYLIDAYRRDDGDFGAATCGSSSQIDEPYAREFLRYLRSRKTGREPTSLAVRVDVADILPHTTVAGAEVRLIGSQGEGKALTDESGVARFENLLAGSYSISVTKTHYAMDVSDVYDHNLTLVDQTCPNTTLGLKPVSWVRGFLRTENGQAAAGLAVELLARDDADEGISEEPGPWYKTETSSGGSFEFQNILPGTYYLGTNLLRYTMTGPIPRTFYPGRIRQEEAIPIQVELGSVVDGLAYVLPDFGRLRQIRIRVVDLAGEPVPGAKVDDSNHGWKGDAPQEGSLGDNLVADKDGWVSCSGYERAWYRVRAIQGSRLQDLRVSDTAEIPPGERGVTLLLVVRPPSQTGR
jgi:hypothetical protein